MLQGEGLAPETEGAHEQTIRLMVGSVGCQVRLTRKAPAAFILLCLEPQVDNPDHDASQPKPTAAPPSNWR